MKKAIVRLIFFYFIDILFLLLICKIFNRNLADLIARGNFWLLPLPFLFLGQILGFLSAYIIPQPERKNKIYKKFAAISSLTFIVTISSCGLYIWDHNNNFANIESNERFFDTQNDDSASRIILQAKVAFDTLIKMFPNANDIKLTEWIIDPGVEGPTLIFFYTKKKYEGIYKAKLTESKKVALLLYYDKQLNPYEIHKLNKDYGEFKNDIQQTETELNKLEIAK
jgi:hypothetical protein